MSINQLGQKKAFYRQRIPEFGFAKKEIVEINILITYSNGDKLIQTVKSHTNFRVTSGPTTRMRKRNEFNQFR